MLANLAVSVQVVTPLVILMLVGVLLRWRKILDSDAVAKLNRVVFFVGIPMMCFKSLLTSDLSGTAGASVLLYSVVIILISFVLLCLIVPRFEKRNDRRGVLIQGMHRPNEAVFGIPIVVALLGENNLTLMMLSIAIAVPLFNFLGVLSLALFLDEKPSFRSVAKKIVTNPIILSVIAGLLLNALNVRFPAPVMSAISSMSNMCTPLAFIALGASLSFGAMKEDIVPITIATVVRLIVFPAVSLLIMALLGFRGEALIVTLIVFGAPTALSSFTLTSQLGGDARLAGEIIASTCLFSMLSMFLWIFMLKQTGLI